MTKSMWDRKLEELEKLWLALDPVYTFEAGLSRRIAYTFAEKLSFSIIRDFVLLVTTSNNLVQNQSTTK